MPSFTRRTSIKLGTGAAAAAVVANGHAARGQIEAAHLSPPDFPIEPGAALRVLRPAKFVEGDETLFLENTGKFTAQTGVPVRVEAEGWEALRPKIAVAANIGNGSIFAGPTNIQSDNTFTQSASNSNTAANVDAFVLLGRLGVPLRG